MTSLFSNERLPIAYPPMEMPYIEKKQDWVTPAIEAFWKAHRENGYTDKHDTAEVEGHL